MNPWTVIMGLVAMPIGTVVVGRVGYCYLVIDL